MKILVVNNMAPFVRGGAEELADHLVLNLNSTKGVQAELLRVPFAWEPAERLILEMYVAQSLALHNVDRVIALKFPAYMIPHRDKTLWLLHQYRQAYDMLESGNSNIPDNARGRELTRLITENDNRCFAECKRIFVNSPVTQARLKRFNGFDSEVLYPPVNMPRDFDGRVSLGDYIFAGGRINKGKRQHLLVEAMAYTKTKVRLVVAGPPETWSDGQLLRDLVNKHQLQDRVTLDFGYLSRRSISNYARNALACAYLPIDEDSVGYVTMEAFSCSKPVLTVVDSGGLLEIVIDGSTGLVTTPDPSEIAEGFDRLASDRRNTKKMGAAAKRLLLDRRLTWPSTIERLLS
jgi:glycosyltransferase involved in cell wall biosynthesis